jgi:hypothetical protein
MIVCRNCGTGYSADHYRLLEYVSGGTFGTTEGRVEKKTGYVEFRSCEDCGAQIRHEVIYGDEDPVTERNPVPSIPPRPVVSVGTGPGLLGSFLAVEDEGEEG